MSIVINLVDNVKSFRELKKANSEKLLTERINSNIEAHSVCDNSLVESDPINGFVSAIHLAYAYDLPLIISPDDLWLTLSQGLSIHINENAEALRPQFVSHEGQVELIVIRNEFVKGSKDNNWPGVFHEFSDQLAGYIGNKRDLLVANFTTTGPLEKVVSEITLMEAMKNYFSYTVHTLCDIPSITLLGETKDWENIRQRVAAMEEFDLGWWTNSLLKIVDQFITASQGKADVDFWKEIYKLDGGSGGPFINGWINQLFPYILAGKKYKRNDEIGRDRKESRWCGLTSENFPSGLSVVPFVWKYYFQEFPMEFVGGFFGACQESNGAIKPALHWAIRDK